MSKTISDMPGEKDKSSFVKNVTSMVRRNTGVYHITVDQPFNPTGRQKTLGSNLVPFYPSIDIEFSELTYIVPDSKKGSKKILSELSGTIYSQKLTAIMGPSGAGKSTLLNVLAGYNTKRLSGNVLMNGLDRKTLRYYRKMICYIMQDDQLLPHLTALEAMTSASNLKLGDEFSSNDKSTIVDEILETLGLTDSKDTYTSHLSGGQRKRLSIALELINNPPVMFFDEPTSGLDSSSCFQCLSLLKTLARGGRTIICSIHQPSARLFEMFDDLYVLAEGQCIYQGQVQGLVPFLSLVGLDCPSYHNPADFVIEVASGDHGIVVPRLVSAVKDGKCTGREVSDIKGKDDSGNEEIVSSEDFRSLAENFVSSGFPVSHFKQFWILWKRTLVYTMRDMMLFWLRLISHILCGLLIGVLYSDIGNDASKVINNSSCLFLTMLFFMFSALMTTIITFPMEKDVLIKEHMNHWYSLVSFYLARTIADIPFQIIFSFLYVSLVYYLSSQPHELFRFSMFLIVCLLTSLVAQSLGLFIGAVMKVEDGVYIGPVLNFPIILVSGFFVSLSNLPSSMKWLSDLSYIRYGFEGSIVALYGYNRTDLHCSDPYCQFEKPETFLKEMDMEKVDFKYDCLALLWFFVFFRVFGFFLLKWKIRSKM